MIFDARAIELYRNPAAAIAALADGIRRRGRTFHLTTTKENT